jgi:hypothetical protein
MRVLEEMQKEPADIRHSIRPSSAAYFKVHTPYGVTGAKQGGEPVVDTLSRAFRNARLKHVSPDSDPAVLPACEPFVVDAEDGTY